MTAYEEIESFRRNGQVKEAYDKAVVYKVNNPSCIWVYNQLGWCLSEMIKWNAAPNHSSEFLMCLQEITDLNKEHSLDGRILRAIAWIIRDFVVKCVANNREDLLYNVFSIMQQIPFDKQDKNYSILLSPFLKAKEWGGLKEVIEWWGIENIKEHDCEAYHTTAGNSIMSFGEHMYIIRSLPSERVICWHCQSLTGKRLYLITG